MADFFGIAGAGITGGTNTAMQLLPLYYQGQNKKRAYEDEQAKKKALDDEISQLSNDLFPDQTKDMAKNAYSTLMGVDSNAADEEIQFENDEQVKGAALALEKVARDRAQSQPPATQIAGGALSSATTPTGAPATPYVQQPLGGVESNFPDDFKYENEYNEAAKNSGIPVGIIAAYSDVESGHGKSLKSKTGVQGIMMVTRATGKRYIPDFDPTNIKHSLEAGSMHLKFLSDKYSGDQAKVAGAYNGGEGVVDEAVKLSESSGLNWQDEIKNTDSAKKMNKKFGYSKTKEIENYIKKIEKAIQKYGVESYPSDAGGSGSIASTQALNAGPVGSMLQKEVLKGPPKMEEVRNQYQQKLAKIIENPAFIKASRPAQEQILKTFGEPYKQLAELEKGRTSQTLTHFDKRTAQWGANARTILRGEIKEANRISVNAGKKKTGAILSKIQRRIGEINRFRTKFATTRKDSVKKALLEEFREFSKTSKKEGIWQDFTGSLGIDPGTETTLDDKKIDRLLDELYSMERQIINEQTGSGATLFEGIPEDIPIAEEERDADDDFNNAFIR